MAITVKVARIVLPAGRERSHDSDAQTSRAQSESLEHLYD